MSNRLRMWTRAAAAVLQFAAALAVAGVTAGISAFALAILCMPLILGAFTPRSPWLEDTAAAIVVAGTAIAFTVSLREMMQKLRGR